MKIRRLAHLCLAACSVSCTTVYAITPPGGWPEASPPTTAALSGPPPSVKNVATSVPTEASPLEARVRVGHARLSRGGDRTTQVLLEIEAIEAEATHIPAHHVLVLDTSGSMEGERLAQASRAAQMWIDAMPDGDRASVVSFDGRARLVGEAGTLGPASRPALSASLRRMSAGGNTCLSCGLDTALVDLTGSGAQVRHVVLLSDGRANEGMVDDGGMRALADRFRNQGIAITTVGMGLSYEPRSLAALAFQTNGRHHFIDRPEHLAELFEEEAERLEGVVSSEATAELTFAPGVELVEVVARAHERGPGSVSVPLGAFAPGQSKTVLVTVRVADDALGPRPLVEGQLRFTDTGGTPRALPLAGATEVVAGASSALDPVVGMRVARGETGRALADAQRLFHEGRRDEALARLARAQREVERRGAVADRTAGLRGDARRAQIRADIRRQIAELQRIEREAATVAPGRPSGMRMERRMIESADPWSN